MDVVGRDRRGAQGPLPQALRRRRSWPDAPGANTARVAAAIHNFMIKSSDYLFESAGEFLRNRAMITPKCCYFFAAPPSDLEDGEDLESSERGEDGAGCDSWCGVG